jgi:signal transduction histidine kinase
MSLSRRRIVTIALLTAGCAGTATWLDLTRPTYFSQIEYRLQDFITRSGRTTPANSDLLFLAIDSDSVSLDPDLDIKNLFSSAGNEPDCRQALQLMAKGWPWDRRVYPMLLRRLLGAGAKVVVFDCVFREPAAGDDAFYAALNQFKSQVVIGSTFLMPESVDFTSRIPSSYAPPPDSLIPAAPAEDDRVGFTNFFAGENKIVRGAQFRVAFREPGKATTTYLSLSAAAVSKAGHPELVPDDLAEHLIRFTGRPRIGFQPRPVFEVFVPEYWEHNYQSGEFLRNKIVVIGAEGRWQSDEIAVPFGSMPGAEVHLNAINAMLHREFLTELRPFGRAAAIIFSALLGAALCLSIRSPWLRLLALALANGGAPFCALWFYNHPGVYLPCLAPLLALNSTVLLSFVSDFTFEQVEEAKLRSTLETREELTHMIIHDLRSPLTIVTGYMDALREVASDKLTATEVKFVAEAQRGADNLNEMITTLLDVDRLEDGKMPLRLQAQDLNQIASKAAARFSPVLKRRSLHCDMPPHSVMVDCDGDLIRRVLENLISNAVKFTKPDGTIRVTLQPNESAVTVSVIDDGNGIPSEQHKHIFEKFGQTETGSEHRHSTGIGLAFCRLAVEAHRGNIGVQSAPGEGSTFWFTLPIRHRPITATQAFASRK